MVSDKFMFFENFKSTADKLPDDMRLKFYDALTDYVFKGLEPEDPVISALVNAFKPSLDKVERRGGNNNPHGQNQHFEVKVGQSRSKVIEGCQQEELSGQNEGKKGQEGRSFLETETETEVKNNLTVIKKEKSIKKFQKPTINEISEYIRSKKLTVDANTFFDYFTEGDWHDSTGQPVRNWKQKLITWDAQGRQQRTMKAAANLLGVKSGTYKGDIPL